MASGPPKVMHFSWISLFYQGGILTGFFFLFRFLGFENPIFLGVLIFLLLFFTLRTFIPRDHRKGMKLVKGEHWSEAIESFKASHDYFKANDWIDRYRIFTMFSSTKMSYREMSLYNIGFCQTQLGNGEEAIATYNRLLELNPKNAHATYALNMLQSVQGEKPEHHDQSI